MAIARGDGTEPYALTVLYGQRHLEEVEASKRVAAQLGAVEHKFVRVELDAIGGSALTDAIEVPKDRDESKMTDIPVTYVPARNTVMLSLALGYAEVVGAEAIYAGVNAVDYSGYPDCRPEYIAAFQTLARLATKAGVEGRPIEIRTPLIQLTKPQIIQRGLELGVDYALTHSCYDPADGRPCGHCDACLIRLKAFESLGMKDPAL
ncbi:Queuosine Biosynthesis QueC ATPase [Fimbriimonas ginsengisoli Gsoil 348]|uniref:7-cyano-7-deazaguanine synthase n=1 Tax=Fimbriimonas ginsengisoli Gsoil 348 TaxID=661478 RepID=A0A068NTT9_FIMGI|nr:Queuosine Biosynthesis QueC ATPase [Fimbriimonas ginsengisoli Gsoil 348]